MTLLADTTVIVDHLRGREGATAVVFDAVANDSLAIARVTQVELASGMRDRQLAAYERLLHFVDVIDADPAIGKRAVELARAWGSSHRATDAIDYVIAATADVRGFPLLTTNVKHFPMFDGLEAPY